MTLLPTVLGKEKEKETPKRHLLCIDRKPLKSESLSLKIKWWQVRMWSYKRHETDTSQRVQTDGGCARSVMREKQKRRRTLCTAEGVRLHQGDVQASSTVSLPAFKSWLQLKGCLASHAKIYANIIRIILRHLYGTAGWWCFNNWDKHGEFDCTSCCW